MGGWRKGDGKIENLALMLCGAMEAQDRVGLMLNVRRRTSTVFWPCCPHCKKSDHLDTERREWVA